MRGLEKNRMKRDKHTRKHTDGHRDSMKESAKGRFFENVSFKFTAEVCGFKSLAWLNNIFRFKLGSALGLESEPDTGLARNENKNLCQARVWLKLNILDLVLAAR